MKRKKEERLEQLDLEIKDCERYIEMFQTITDGYKVKLERLKKEIKNG